MNITPTTNSTPKYPVLAAAALSAALATASCQQQVAGAPREIQPLTVSYVDEQGKVIRSIETTHGEWEKNQQSTEREPQPLPGVRKLMKP